MVSTGNSFRWLREAYPVVLGLPLMIPLLTLMDTQYGILAGLTLYAVPQVLAATVPAGIVSGEQIPQPVNTDRTRAA